ncbi:MAG: exodeoxyribonuclease V subunit alpha [Cyclonatronaceae bacterium]
MEYRPGSLFESLPDQPAPVSAGASSAEQRPAASRAQTPGQVQKYLYEMGVLNALDIGFGAFLKKKGEGSAHVILAAALLSAAARMGHSALDLRRLPQEGQAFFGRPGQAEINLTSYRPSLPDFKDSALVAHVKPEDDVPPQLPLVLEGSRLYFNRFFSYEHRISATLSALASQKIALDTRSQEQAKAQLGRYFESGESAHYQKMAGVAALTQKLTIITGGPGTGKTYTVLRLLAMLLEQNEARNLRIAIAAPTGKAANRVRESVVSGLEELPLTPELKRRIPLETQTLHRLLGVRYRSASFRHHREHPLPYDIIIIDEASMIDIGLMAKLLDALPESARLILLGDKYQLASVEAGAVFADLCASENLNELSSGFAKICRAVGLDCPAGTAGNGQKAPLQDSIVELTYSHRFKADSGIGRLAACINAGDAEGTIALLKEAPEGVSWLPATPESYLKEWRDSLKKQYHGYKDDSKTPAEKAALMKAFQLLSAHRRGKDGVEGLNEHIERLLGVRKRTGSPWYNGRPVIMTRNDYQQGLFNGDLGITQKVSGDENEHLRVGIAAFDKQKQQEVIRLRRPAQLQEMETCWALSVHKSQGSEYENVLLALPQNDSPVLTRELIYTAVTRAKKHICIAGSEALIRAAVSRKTKRFSGLPPRLWPE